MDLKELQKKLGYCFKEEQIFITALTHSSWVNENNPKAEHNERLEFLGDAVLEICISEELFKRHPDAREGELTRMRSTLVNTKMLVILARNLHLDQYVLLARGEENQGGRQRDALLADTMEAVIGGVFLDGDFFCVKGVIANLYSHYWPEKSRVLIKDFKTRLQEETQRHIQGLPRYILEGMHGPEHEKIFDVRVELPNGQIFRASGTGLKRAEQEAAHIALEALKKNHTKITKE